MAFHVFKVGDRVEITGYKAKPELNGEIGKINGGVIETSGEWPVKLYMDDSVQSFNGENLKPAPIKSRFAKAPAPAAEGDTKLTGLQAAMARIAALNRAKQNA